MTTIRTVGMCLLSALPLWLAACGEDAPTAADDARPASEPTSLASPASNHAAGAAQGSSPDEGDAGVQNVTADDDSPDPPERTDSPAPVQDAPPGGSAAPPPTTAPAQAPPYDEHRDYIGEADTMLASLLGQAVTPEGLVRYDALATPENTATLSRLVNTYGDAKMPESRPKRLAFLCNAYNANVVAMVLRERSRPGFINVIKVEGFFDRMQITVARRQITLNVLENEIIRPMGDPRIHAALVCAAMSCPPLRAEPFKPERLDEQFDDQCRRWVNDPERNTVRGEQLVISRIFEWFKEDFDRPPYDSVVGFLRAYADPDSEIGKLLARNPSPGVSYMEYDWTLNAATARDMPEK
jgi:hypothetical protein